VEHSDLAGHVAESGLGGAHILDFGQGYAKGVLATSRGIGTARIARPTRTGLDASSALLRAPEAPFAARPD
jgi:hypothetical protein